MLPTVRPISTSLLGGKLVESQRAVRGTGFPDVYLIARPPLCYRRDRVPHLELLFHPPPQFPPVLLVNLVDLVSSANSSLTPVEGRYFCRDERRVRTYHRATASRSSSLSSQCWPFSDEEPPLADHGNSTLLVGL